MSHHKNKSGLTRTALKWLRLKMSSQKEETPTSFTATNVNVTFKGKKLQSLTDKDYEEMKEYMLEELKGYKNSNTIPIIYGGYKLGKSIGFIDEDNNWLSDKEKKIMVFTNPLSYPYLYMSLSKYSINEILSLSNLTTFQWNNVMTSIIMGIQPNDDFKSYQTFEIKPEEWDTTNAPNLIYPIQHSYEANGFVTVKGLFLWNGNHVISYHDVNQSLIPGDVLNIKDIRITIDQYGQIPILNTGKNINVPKFKDIKPVAQPKDLKRNIIL